MAGRRIQPIMRTAHLPGLLPEFRIIEESDIRKRIDTEMTSVRSMIEPMELTLGAKIRGQTALHLHSILDSVEAITIAMDEEWAKERPPGDQKVFLNQKVHEKIALREIRTIIQSVADLIQCKQQKYFSEREKKKKEAMPVATESHNSQGRISSSGIPLFDAAQEPGEQMTSEIKEEPIDELYPRDLQPFVPSEEIKEDAIPKLEEPEMITFGFPSTSQEKVEKVKEQVPSIQPERSEICHFCSFYTCAFVATPDDPLERRAFLINLHCQWQEESNAREVLLCNLKKVYFCYEHIKKEYSEMIKLPAKSSNVRTPILPNKPLKRQRGAGYSINSPASLEKSLQTLIPPVDTISEERPRKRKIVQRNSNSQFPDYPCITSDPHQH